MVAGRKILHRYRSSTDHEVVAEVAVSVSERPHVVGSDEQPHVVSGVCESVGRRSRILGSIRLEVQRDDPAGADHAEGRRVTDNWG